MAKSHWKLRKRWHAENPHCRKCNKLTTLELIRKASGDLRHDVATIEHIHPKGHPDRNLGIKTLYCHSCNRASIEYYQITGKLFSEYDGQWTMGTKNKLKAEYGYGKDEGVDERQRLSVRN